MCRDRVTIFLRFAAAPRRSSGRRPSLVVEKVGPQLRNLKRTIFIDDDALNETFGILDEGDDGDISFLAAILEHCEYVKVWAY